MAQVPTQQTTSTSIEDAFLADRALFWHRFTNFTTGSVIAVVVLLLGMLVFLW